MDPGLIQLLFWPTDELKQIIQDAADSMVENALNQMASGLSTTLGQVITKMGALWVGVDPVSFDAGGTGAETVTEARQSLQSVTLAVLVLSVIIGGARVAWEKRFEPVQRLGVGLLTASMVSAGSLSVVALLIKATDGLAAQLVSEQDTTELGKLLTAALAVNVAGQPVGVYGVVLVTMTALIISLIQMILLVVRSGMLLLLMAVMPLAASLTTLDIGRQWFQKCWCWTLAFVLYKPVAALLYFIGLKLLQVAGKNVDFTAGVTAVTVLALAVVAMPALMRFCTPLVGAMANGSFSPALPSGSPSGAKPTGAKPSGAPPTGTTAPADRGDSKPSGSSAPGPKGSPASSTPGSAFSGSAPKPSAGPSGGAGAGKALSGAGSAAGGSAAAGAGTAAGVAAAPATGGASLALALGAARGGKRALQGMKQTIDSAIDSSDGGGPSGSR